MGLGDVQTDPCWLGKGGTVDRQANSTNVYLDARFGGEGDPPKAAVSYALDADAGKNAEDCKENKGAKIEGHNEADEEGDGGKRHGWRVIRPCTGLTGLRLVWLRLGDDRYGTTRNYELFN